MKHLLFIDPLEKLVVKKDSTLLLAQSLKEMGHEVFLLFEKDFYFTNEKQISFDVYQFEAQIEDNQGYLEYFELGETLKVELNSNITIHMRLDPPFDSRYLRYLWILLSLESQFRVKLLNHPKGILYFNEKLASYTQKGAVSSFVGASIEGFLSYYRQIHSSLEAVVFKPLDLFQGLGVEKIETSLGEQKVLEKFESKVKELSGPVVVQPYIKDVEKGEIRTLFFKNEHLGSIIKIPKEGEFLSNIARGASYTKIELSRETLKKCNEVSNEFSQYGVDWIAFDIIGETIQEINITCPGLLCEVSKAHQKNLAKEIAKKL